MRLTLFVSILLLLLGAVLASIAEARGREQGRRELCPDLMAAQATRADSVAVVARWPECAWWPAEDPARGAFS